MFVLTGFLLKTPDCHKMRHSKRCEKLPDMLLTPIFQQKAFIIIRNPATIQQNIQQLPALAGSCKSVPSAFSVVSLLQKPCITLACTIIKTRIADHRIAGLLKHGSLDFRITLKNTDSAKKIYLALLYWSAKQVDQYNKAK